MTSPRVTTLVWDIDDTLYDVGTGFTAHRNGDAVFDFMVEALGFETRAEAKVLRDEYFAKTHATGKALAVAEADGRLPPGAHFELADLAEWWSSKLDFSMLQPDPVLTEALASCPLRHVCFTNSPRKYGIRCLEALGIRQFFKDADIFAVDDVLRLSGGACKPEAAAFQAVFDACGVRAEECVMLEDSMKNVRAAKALGMRTVLVTGLQEDVASRATNMADQPDAREPLTAAPTTPLAQQTRAPDGSRPHALPGPSS
eukprot:Transcript_12716.p1 GENE.Transcript_12716~~Transcript_12716.p1  ORF type:complete len:277 (-),score=99.82 Transcript_12716:255-1025(-)